MSLRSAIVCPGRGAYSERTLRSLPEHDDYVQRAESLRRERGLESLVGLDRAERFSSARHLLPANAAPLIWLVSMLDARAALATTRCVCVAGNSMGWYTALTVAGALSFEDGFRLVQELAILQQEHGAGGQLLYPVCDEQWRPDPVRAALVEAALAAAPGEAFRSIELAGFVVLAGSEVGLAQLLSRLPAAKLGANSYPLRLLQHGPYHSPLVAPVAERARTRLAGLDFRVPAITLIDGRGRRRSPWSTDPAQLREYTFGEQLLEPYSLSASLCTVLCEFAPARILLPGPGNTLGAVVGQALVAQGWRSMHSKADFESVQASAEPIVISMRR